MTSKTLEQLAKAYEYVENYERLAKDTGILIKQHLGYFKRDAWEQSPAVPEFAITLGSGLGGLADQIENAKAIPYEELPAFPQTTVQGHEGKLIFGTIEGVNVVALKGRKHYYEFKKQDPTGMLQVTFPVHVMAELGVKNYLATNAVGGLNECYNKGHVMIIKSHINMMGDNPLTGKQLDFKKIDGSDTDYFLPMNNAYDRELSELLYRGMQRDEAPNTAVRWLHKGTLLSVQGRNYETESESQAFRAMGADAVGMSVVPEVLAARLRGMRCVGMSCITNKILADGSNPASHKEVEETAGSEEVNERMSEGVKNFFRLYKERHM